MSHPAWVCEAEKKKQIAAKAATASQGRSFFIGIPFLEFGLEYCNKPYKM